ncbi:MAG: ankyrin repeat domain-containing protein [Lysobacter sp.]|nr:ankyrin repeat domain-containing protein [Lysobacter sp.]
MKAWAFAVAVALAVPHTAAREPSAGSLPADIPVCKPAQRKAYLPSAEEIAAHRLSDAPVIRYPYGTEMPNGGWDMELTMRVDASGRVVCYSDLDRFGRKQTVSGQRTALLRDLRYRPFRRDGQAVEATLTEGIAEEELPQERRPLPEVPLEQVRIVLSRSGCLGTCPDYRVELHGNGEAVYEGNYFVDVEGKHAYRVDPSRVAALVGSLRAKDLWSLRPSYRARVTDNPTYVLSLTLGAQTHAIEDYVGERAGMPRAVSEFEREVDEVSRSAMWIRLEPEALKLLESEGFDFASAAGADLLARAVANENGQEAVLLELIALGAPTEPARRTPKDDPKWDVGSSESIVTMALRRRHTKLAAALIDEGALETGGRVDPVKLNEAFAAAIAGGGLAGVQRVWEAADGKPYPSLSFLDTSGDDDKPDRKQVPVSLMLYRNVYPPRPMEGVEIAQWLAARGCDLKARGADGDTLLHNAAAAGDAKLVRYLLDQGLDPSTPGQFDLPALGSARDEEVALMLLQAGTDLSKLGDFRQYVDSNRWNRVDAWLQANRDR